MVISEGASTISLLLDLAFQDRELSKINNTLNLHLKFLSDCNTKLKLLSTELNNLTSRSAEKKLYVAKEEKAIKIESEKLKERRVQLQKITEYKLQDSIKREIDSSSEIIRKREDQLLNHMQELESLEQQQKNLTEQITELNVAIDQRMKEYKAVERDHAEVQAKTLANRIEKFAILPAKIKQHYERSIQRNPHDPIVTLSNNNCSGCYMQLSPREVTTLHNSSEVIKCPGCSRIIYLPLSSSS